VFVQDHFDAVQLASGKSVVLAKPDRTCRTVQIEDSFRPRTDDVNVCWPVVVRVDDYPKVANSQDGRRRRRIAYS
jgi:hypothetical protein